MIHHITRATRHLIFWGLLAIALILTAIRLILSVINVYKEDLEIIVSKEISAPVKIGHLGAGMRGFRPELLLKNVQILAEDPTQKAPLDVQEIRLSMDLLQSYGQKQILASSWITLVGARTTVVRHLDGSIAVRGLPASNTEPPTWILHTAQFEMLHSQITWLDEMLPATSKLPPSLLPAKPIKDALVFKEANVTLKSDQDGQRHLINMLVTLPKPYGDTISVSMQLRGNFLTADGINGLIYIEGKQLQLAKLLTAYPLPLDLRVADGAGTINVWSYWQHSQLQAITGTTQLQQLVLQRPAQAPLAIKQLRNRFNWINQNEQWALRIDALSVNSAAIQLTDTRVLLKGTSTAHSAALSRVEIQMPQLDLQQSAQVGRFFGVVDALPFPVDALQGQLKSVSLMLAPDAKQFAVQSAFEHISLAAHDDFPGITNISGDIQGNQQQGTVNIAIKNTALDLPRIFAKPLPINDLHTQILWQQDAENWVVTSQNLALAVPDMQANSHLQLKINRSTHAVWMDVQSVFNGSRDIKSFGIYWPNGLMGTDSVNWLKQALLKGYVNPRGFLFSGAVADFPFPHKQGVFELILDFKSIDFRYAPDWEPVRDIDAEVLFYNGGMQISALQASVQGAKLQQFDLNVPSFFQVNPYINVDIKGAGDIMQTLGYLRQSPIKNEVDRLLQIITPQGLAPINLAIQVPIVDQNALKLQGSLLLQDVSLNVLPLTLPVSHLQGEIAFNERGIIGGQLQGQALDGGINVSIKNNAEKMLLTVLGHTDVIDLQQQFGIPLWRYAQGDTDYQLNLTLPNNKTPASLALKSDLVGVALRLPDNLAKLVAVARPVNLHMNLTEGVLLPMTLQMDKLLQASMVFNTKEKSLVAAEVRVGAGELGAAPAKGGNLIINVEQCTLADWIDLASSATDTLPFSTPFFEQITLKANQALWQGQPLGKLDVQMQHAQQAWHMDIDSQLLKGHIDKPSDATQDKPMLLDLEYINLSGLSHLKASEPQLIEDKHLPLFNLTSKQVVWEGVNVGMLALDTARIPNGIAFKQMSLKNAQGELNLTGDWTINNAEKQLMTVKGTFAMRGFGEFLSTMGVAQDLKATDAVADIAVNWQGAPQNFSLERLNGRVGIELKNGRILSIEPGFGRLLGFLAFEQWERRLRLDFSDMLAEGLTFNRIHGHFDLDKGDAITNNLVVDAVPAEVNITGVAHLAERSMDYHARVLPKSSAALPIAGTIVDRILTFSLETVTGNSQAGFLLGSEYKILGQWDNPQVIRLRENDGLLQKTWYGLTDFSWLKKNIKNTNREK